MKHILLVEDYEPLRNELEALLLEHAYQIATAASVEQASADYALDDFDLILTDLRFVSKGVELRPGTDLIGLAAPVPVIVLTGYATFENAVEAGRMGARGYLQKEPFQRDALLEKIKDVLDDGRHRRKLAALQRDLERSYPASGVLGTSPEMRKLSQLMTKLAPTDATVLILGESGTGKELIARAIHQQSLRKDAALVALNCGAISPGLMLDQLFGHEQGAFTGATKLYKGCFEQAHGGSLFLDEIGELSTEAQVSLLRVLETGEVTRLGGGRPVPVDVRVIAATHRDLRSMVDAGAFREDLAYRLGNNDLRVPPLRERGDDLELLARHFLSTEAGKHAGPAPNLSAEALGALRAHSWKGNVRELRNAIERGVIQCEDGCIRARDLGFDGWLYRATTAPAAGEDETLDAAQAAHVRAILLKYPDETNERIAKRLDVTRQTVARYCDKLGLSRRSSKR
jgi:DNA-binding NtrC family response regulator